MIVNKLEKTKTSRLTKNTIWKMEATSKERGKVNRGTHFLFKTRKYWKIFTLILYDIEVILSSFAILKVS